MTIIDHARELRRSGPRYDDIFLTCNPTQASRWTGRTGEICDISEVGCEWGQWSVSCNQPYIGPGTIGWFVRTGFGFPPLAGFMVVDGDPPSPRAK